MKLASVTTLPSISVVTVTLNAANKIARLFASLRAQTDRDFELIVLDGASTDGTWDIVCAASDIVTFSKSEPDTGIYAALNKAVEKTRTDFYVVAGADDILYPDAVRSYKKLALSSSADVIIAGVKVGSGLRKFYRPQRAWLGHPSMITSHSVGMLIRTELHQRIGPYPVLYPILADGYLIKKLCADDEVRKIEGNFVAGEFSTDGTSNRRFFESLVELWRIQVATGENPMLQYLLFQLRLFKNLPKVLRSISS